MQSDGDSDGDERRLCCCFVNIFTKIPFQDFMITWLLPVGLCLWYTFFLIGLKRLDKKIGKEVTRKITRWMTGFGFFYRQTKEKMCVMCVFDCWFACAKSTSYDRNTQFNFSPFTPLQCKISWIFQIVAIGHMHTHKHKENTNRLFLISEKAPHYRYTCFYLCQWPDSEKHVLCGSPWFKIEGGINWKAFITTSRNMHDVDGFTAKFLRVSNSNEHCVQMVLGFTNTTVGHSGLDWEWTLFFSEMKWA